MSKPCVRVTVNVFHTVYHAPTLAGTLLALLVQPYYGSAYASFVRLSSGWCESTLARTCMQLQAVKARVDWVDWVTASKTHK